MSGSTAPFTQGVGVARHRLGEAPEQVAIGDHLAGADLLAAVVLGAGRLERLHHQAGDELQLDGQAGAAVQQRARQEAGLGKKLFASSTSP